MTNPFSFSSPDMLSQKTLALSITEYQRFLQHLGQFSNSTQLQEIRVQVRDALADLMDEAEKRYCTVLPALG